MYPKIYLAIDNCFASKRWTAPAEWMAQIRGLGLALAEGSADTECDPLYHGRDYLRRWTEDVLEASARTGVRMANLYSGHGTYATLGLSHTDPAVRRRFLHDWLEVMADTAKAVDAGLGFFCHAFPDAVLQDPARYAEFRAELVKNLAALAVHAAGIGAKPIAVEQMYSPHQIPWTISGAEALLRDVCAAGAPFYLTIDVGHQTGQRKFRRLTAGELDRALAAWDRGEFQPDLWLGPRSAEAVFEDSTLSRPERVRRIEAEMDRYPHLFAPAEDGSPYAWLEALAPYSPIIHLQQTDGQHSAHWPFTPAYNDLGIIEPQKVLRAIAAAYDRPETPGMPPRVTDITLTLEIFTGTAAINRGQLEAIRQSAAYWRRAVPRDGLSLEQLL